ncbi:MAG: hypothetical protein OEZ34_14070 [Spirochaetia bacterium]|nr:hypothetical protein [Spirochaetia bacterium]
MGIQKLIISLLLLLSIFCTSFQSAEKPLDSYHGIWLLNREKTLEIMLKKRGEDFRTLSTGEQTRMISSFPFDLIVEFSVNGEWKGSFLDTDGTANNGNGVYTSTPKNNNEFVISVEEKSGKSSFANSFILNVSSDREIRIQLSGKETVELILNRTRKFYPINKRPEMVSPNSRDI